MALPELNSEGLLPEGIHPATADDLKERFVDPFAASTTRQRIFDGFLGYQTTLAGLGVHATQWVDGSFVDAARVDPEDIDVVNFCDAAMLNAVPPARQALLQPLLDGRAATKAQYDTHSFLVVHFPAGRPYAAQFEDRRKYWRDWLSRPQDYSGPNKTPAPWRGRKGIVQMNVGDANLCPTVGDTA